MQSKFRFSLDGTDATSRQFKELRRELRESSANANGSLRRLGERVSVVENDFESLTGDRSRADSGKNDAVVVPAHGGTGVRNVFDGQLPTAPRKPVYCAYDGRLGSDCSRLDSVTGVSDADGFVPVDALRRLKWRVFLYKNDLNLKLDDAQPVVGLLADDLDAVGLGFFCEYDDDGVPVGVDYPKLGVAALRLAQEALDEVDGLKAVVESLSSEVDRIKEVYVKNPTVGE